MSMAIYLSCLWRTVHGHKVIVSKDLISDCSELKDLGHGSISMTCDAYSNRDHLDTESLVESEMITTACSSTEYSWETRSSDWRRRCSAQGMKAESQTKWKRLRLRRGAADILIILSMKGERGWLGEADWIARQITSRSARGRINHAQSFGRAPRVLLLLRMPTMRKQWLLDI